MLPFTVVILFVFVSYSIANFVQFAEHLIFNQTVLLIMIFVPSVSKASYILKNGQTNYY
jgi:hypothetical protein